MNGDIQFIHTGPIDPYVDIQNDYYNNSFDCISKQKAETKNTKALDKLSNTRSISSNEQLNMPDVPDSCFKTSKSAYHYEWHVDPAPDYYQNFNSSSPYYGIACGPVSAAMLIAYYDINCPKLSTLVPNVTMPVSYEDEPLVAQKLINEFCVDFHLEENDTSYSNEMTDGLTKYCARHGFSLNAIYTNQNPFQTLKDITYDKNVCIIHTEDHWSLGIGYYNVNGDGEYGIVHVGWKNNRGNYYFKKNLIDGILYLSEDRL